MNIYFVTEKIQQKVRNSIAQRLKVADLNNVFLFYECRNLNVAVILAQRIDECLLA